MNSITKITKLSVLCSILTLVQISLVVAEDDSERGRLPDGRAYRTDQEGNEIVDYVAELELQVEALNRRVVGLEDEVKEKQARLERVKLTGSGDQQLLERTLVDSKRVDSNSSHQIQPEFADRDTSTLNTESACAELKQSYDKRVAYLQQQIDEKAFKVESSSEQEQGYKQTIARLTESNDANSKILKEKQLEIERLRASLLKNQQMQLAVADSTKEILADKKQESKSIWSSLWGEEADQQQEQQQVNAALRPEASSPQSNAKTRVLQSLQGSLGRQLNQLRSAIAQRNLMFSESQALLKSGPVSFSPNQALSSRNYSVAMIETSIKNAKSVHELSMVSRDIAEIQRKMNDDIELINRVKRSRRG